MPRQTGTVRTSASRTERKRATDRNAQREHRKRHKEYIKELEDKVKVLSSDFQADARCLALIEERTLLKEQCKSLAARLERIQSISKVQGGAIERYQESEPGNKAPPSTGSGDNTSNEQEINLPNFTSQIYKNGGGNTPAGNFLISNPNNSAERLPVEGVAHVEHSDQLHLTSTPFMTGIDDWDLGTFEQRVMLIPDHGIVQDNQVEHGSNDPFSSNHLDVQHETFILEDFLPDATMNTAVNNSHAADEALTLKPSSTSQSTKTPLWSDKDPRPHIFSRGKGQEDHSEMHIPAFLGVSEDLFSEFVMLPNCQPPSTFHELVYDDIVREARAEHKAGRFDTTDPSLSRILSKEPADILSFRLFYYMSTWGPMPMHLFLAVFWVHYLYLRWEVLLTQEAYRKVPTFLRPRHIERLMPHRLAIKMLVCASHGRLGSHIQESKLSEQVIGTNFSMSSIENTQSGSSDTRLPNGLLNQWHSQPRNIKIIHIGAGATGLCAAYKMERQLQNYELVCYEKNDEIGGTWYENRYPGCACDVPAHIYTYTFEPKPDWKSYYAFGPEIQQYFVDFAKKYHLRKYIKLNHQVISTRWDEDRGQYKVKIKTRDTVLTDWCHVLMNGSGLLNKWRFAKQLKCFMRSNTWITPPMPRVPVNAEGEEDDPSGGVKADEGVDVADVSQYFYKKYEIKKMVENPEFLLNYRKQIEFAINYGNTWQPKWRRD
ncbi:hypothetical protein G7Y89_g12367 [Cudoniella acicularis]|uniref:Flavin-containing monooxygenase n=1 Tax=Cudoniella acicularis TaxID=354080 RepID=A0A8H4VX31_9HELO|nr:hypothetical protein G7Y89_g12367 [Cudoniella acicularis]